MIFPRNRGFAFEAIDTLNSMYYVGRFHPILEAMKAFRESRGIALLYF
jgi:hypothetical protein